LQKFSNKTKKEKRKEKEKEEKASGIVSAQQQKRPAARLPFLPKRCPLPLSPVTDMGSHLSSLPGSSGRTRRAPLGNLRVNLSGFVRSLAPRPRQCVYLTPSVRAHSPSPNPSETRRQAAQTRSRRTATITESTAGFW
jgi:hypothetical protein